MRQDATALKVAIDLLRIPSRVRRVRSQPLPGGVVVLLQIAAGGQEAERWAAGWTGKSPQVIREAAAFFIEQILLSPESDDYRILGTHPDATTAELRRNMVLLLKGMHPDIEDGIRSVFTRRVTKAWNTLKTPDRRAAYDATRRRRVDQQRSHEKNGAGLRTNKAWVKKVPNRAQRQNSKALDIRRPAPEGMLRRALRMLLAGGRA